MVTEVDDIRTRLEIIEREIDEIRRRTQDEQGGKRHRTPPGGIEEIENILKERHGNKDRIVSLTTLQRRPDSPSGWADWSYLSAWMEGVVVLDIPAISTFMESCASEMRLKILHEIYKSPKYPKELTATTGLTGGALYHHLDVLVENGLTARDELGRAILTENGQHLADIVFTAIAHIAGAHHVVEGRRSTDWMVKEESVDREESDE